MPPKRSKASESSPSKKRRIQSQSKGSQGDSGSLDSFFRRASEIPALTKTDETHRIASSSKVMLDGIEDDETIALKLAAKEGVDIETTRALEQKWKSSVSSRNKQTFSEVIDVDAVCNTGISGTSPEESFNAEKSTVVQANNRDGDAFSPRQAIPSPVFGSRKSFMANPQEVVIDISSYPTLAVDPLCFTLTDCPWGKDSSLPTPYSFLAHTLCSLSGTRSRIAISNILTNALRSIIFHDPPSLLPALYLLSNSLAPPYVPIELGLGPSIISKAIQHVSGLSPAALKRLYTRTGDTGDVAFEARSNLRTLIPHPALTVADVYNSLLKICHTKGDGAMKQKQSIVEKLLVAAKGEEIRYLVRTMAQHIRVGAVRTSILTALARALVLTRPISQSKPSDDSPYFVSSEFLSSVKESTGKGKKNGDDPIRSAIAAKFIDTERLLKQTYVQHPNYEHIAKALLDVGPEGLSDKVLLSVGIPLHPALGSPTRSLDEVYDRIGSLPFAAEFKYDGQRAQIHAEKTDGGFLIRIFSRHLEDMTDKYPDVVSLVEELFKSYNDLKPFIIDTEIVAIDPADGSLKSFQELSNRARKDVKLEEIKISVCVFAFDLMFYNDNSLLECPFRDRRQKLRTHFPPFSPDVRTIARFAHVESCESEDGREAVEEFWQRAAESRSEGLMIKLLDSGEVLEDPSSAKAKQRKKPLPATYEPDKRTSAWLKLKKDYVLGLGDSLDLVPIGAWHGNGRKAAWWSPILLALWDEGAGQLVGVCKCMSGFTDEFYKALSERYTEGSEVCSRTSLWNVNTGGLRPEVYFKPQEVWEIRGADVTISPVSVAALGLVSQDRGLSLRFPRFIRTREDKGVMEASTPGFLATMWRNQLGKGKEPKGFDDGDLVDISPEVSELEEEESE